MADTPWKDWKELRKKRRREPNAPKKRRKRQELAVDGDTTEDDVFVFMYPTGTTVMVNTGASCSDEPETRTCCRFPVVFFCFFF